MNPVELGKLAGAMRAKAVNYQRGRAGRTSKGPQMKQQLHAAGQPRMNTRGVFGYPRGRGV
jgi:hypothetical protein